MDSGAELGELDAASLAAQRVARDLRVEGEVLAELVGALDAAAGLVPSRRACARAGEALVPALRRLADAAQGLAGAAAWQADGFRRADGAA